MLQKFKITTCAFILCLFGLTMTDVTNVYARPGDSEEILECAEMRGDMKKKKDCFARVARHYYAIHQRVYTEYNPPYKQGNAYGAAKRYCESQDYSKIEGGYGPTTTSDYAVCEAAYKRGLLVGGSYAND